MSKRTRKASESKKFVVTAEDEGDFAGALPDSGQNDHPSPQPSPSRGEGAPAHWRHKVP